jgi:hypothetical protein
MKQITHSLWVAGLTAMLAGGLHAQTKTIQFAIQNVGPQDGLWIMRPWIGLHDGNFPTFMVGAAASPAVEHIAEDGVTGDTTSLSLLSGPGNACFGSAPPYASSDPNNPGADCMYQTFMGYANGSQQVSIGGPAIPGATLVHNFSVDPSDPNSRYLSFLVMIIPSNDAFFGTDSAHPIRLYDDQGRFNGGHGPIRFHVLFKDIMDAGTEVNTENSTDTAFLGQSVSGTGTHPDTNPVVHPHALFGSGIVNGHNIYPGSQYNYFDKANFQGPIAEITISELP